MAMECVATMFTLVPLQAADATQWRIQKTGKGGSKVSSAKREELNPRKARKIWGYAHSGAVKLGKIPFSARGSPILDCVDAANSQLASLG